MKLRSPINESQAQTFRGVIDFYCWKGLPVARAWPRRPQQPGTVAQVQTWTAMQDMHTWIQEQPSQFKKQWLTMAVPPNATAEDMIRKIGLRLQYAGVLENPPPVKQGVRIPVPAPGGDELVVVNYSSVSWDVNAVTWRFKGYETELPAFTYYIEETFTNRYLDTQHRYWFLNADWSLPLSINWSPAIHGYEMRTDQVHSHYAFFPVLKDPDFDRIPLGPIWYTGQIYPEN